MSNRDYTLKAIRLASNLNGSKFENIYSRAFTGHPLEESEWQSLLTTAILLLRSTEPLLNQLGYRIILQYTWVNGDYRPLHDVAVAKDYIPVVELASRSMHENLPSPLAKSLISASNTNYWVNAGEHGTFRTRGQMRLRAFASRNGSRIVVAPTSYGKSELLAAKVRSVLDGRVCVVVPSKALLAQTARTLSWSSSDGVSYQRPLTHPDSYSGQTSFVAVLTQERLFRLFQKNPELRFDLMLVDEAHGMLPHDDRSALLLQVLMIAAHRNPALETVFYTPFLSRAESLTHVNQNGTLAMSSSQEHVKIEKIYFKNRSSTQLHLFDQFLKTQYKVNQEVPSDEFKAVVCLAGKKNIVYVNRPRDAEKSASQLSAILPELDAASTQEAMQAIGELIHPQYSLIHCISRGVVFHHGKVPEIVRQFVERLFSDGTTGSPRYLCTTSTLLEGVNTPADRMFILNPYKGRSHLSPMSFRNLIGRVSRFKEIFDPHLGGIEGLQPKIFVFGSRFDRADFLPFNFLKKTADAAIVPTDKILNPLLENSIDQTERPRLLEELENYEPGAAKVDDVRRVASEAGQACYKNGIRDFDVFDHEGRIQGGVDLLRSQDFLATEVSQILPTITSLFFQDVDLSKMKDLERVVNNEAAQRFYSMFLDWRSKRYPYKLMIASILRHWKDVEDSPVYVGTAWGDSTFDETGHMKAWVDLRSKTAVERVNLAVAKVKEEQDFIDHKLMRYVEALNDLGLVSESLYSRLKYGTDDPTEIGLIRAGASVDLTGVIVSRYRDFIDLKLDTGAVEVRTGLAGRMLEMGENKILAQEADGIF